MKRPLHPSFALFGLTLGGLSLHAHAADDASADVTTSSDTIEVTAPAIQSLQSLGVSTIGREEIETHPPARDVSELVRTMPGVNLIGNSTSGQRGNNRQIDLRGMGPENTLILVDGLPVSSRGSVRYGWRGERDSRGDSNWVPPEMIERIDVIRGPAAARYGNGAAGGVVNIITKKSSDKQWHGTLGAYMNAPQHRSEGATRRTNFSLTGPLAQDVDFRLFGNYSKTDADAWDINEGHQSTRTGAYATTIPAGREGVVDKDINAVVDWHFTPHQTVSVETGFGRQGNLYAGDTQNTNSSALVRAMYGKETNVLYRETFALRHKGQWDDGKGTESYLQYEQTRNTRMNEGLAGGTEGIFSDNGFSTARLNSLTAHSEVTLPFTFVRPQSATFGAEWNHQRLHDSSSTAQTTTEGGAISGLSSSGRSADTSADLFSLFTEDNIALTPTTRLTPGLRLDHHSTAGTSMGPSLNVSQELGSDFTLKMGIARAYKAPNLYQTNPNYVLYSRGQGCYTGTPCYLLGNESLKPETSINKELGVEFHHGNVLANLTYFRNDYHNKVEAGTSAVSTTTNGKSNVYQWENVPRAVIQGIEGSVSLPVTETVTWNNNLTWMLENRNKSTNDYLSVIPEYTLNSTLSWQATDDVSLRSTLTWYGVQKPKKYNYKGEATSGSERQTVSPYALIGMSGTYRVNSHLSVTAGMDNLLDKRHFREGNAQTTGNATTNAYMYGAGAATYNDPGRTVYVGVQSAF